MLGKGRGRCAVVQFVNILTRSSIVGGLTHNYCRVTFALYHRKDRFVSVKLCQKETLSCELFDCIGKPKLKCGVTMGNENLSLLNTSKLSEVRENANAQVMIGFSFLMI